MSIPSDPLEIRIAARRAEGRRALVGALLGVLLALALGAVLWAALDNLPLGAAVGGILAILLPPPLAALLRSRRRS